MGAMPIVSEAARRADSGSSGFGRRGGWSPSSSTMVPGSDSRAAAVLQCDEREESDGAVQSSYRGPFETMDALQDALPSNRSVQSAALPIFLPLVIRTRAGSLVYYGFCKDCVACFSTPWVMWCTADRNKGIVVCTLVLFLILSLRSVVE